MHHTLKGWDYTQLKAAEIGLQRLKTKSWEWPLSCIITLPGRLFQARFHNLMRLRSPSFSSLSFSMGVRRLAYYCIVVGWCTVCSVCGHVFKAITLLMTALVFLYSRYLSSPLALLVGSGLCCTVFLFFFFFLDMLCSSPRVKTFSQTFKYLNRNYPVYVYIRKHPIRNYQNGEWIS